jgi:hypothetical protein
VPVFAKSASASENSLIGSGRSLSVENNYGYQGPVRPPHRCDHTARLRADGHQQARQRLRAVWTNHTESAPAWVPKLSTTNSPGPHARGFRIWREAVTASAPRRQSGVAASGQQRPPGFRSCPASRPLVRLQSGRADRRKGGAHEGC